MFPLAQAEVLEKMGYCKDNCEVFEECSSK